MAFTMTQLQKAVEPSPRQSPPPLESEIPTLQYSLFFKTDLESTRCDAFPSWSWAGWTGEKWWYGFDYYCHWATDPNIVFAVAVELEPECTISWKEFQNRYAALRLQSVPSIKFIHIQAYLVPILGHKQTHDSTLLEVSNDLQGGTRSLVWILADFEHGTDMREIERCALLRFYYPWPHRYPSMPHLVVRKNGTHWERTIQFEGRYINWDGKRVDPSLWPGVLQTIRLG
jgi:hypothetical protein